MVSSIDDIAQMSPIDDIRGMSSIGYMRVRTTKDLGLVLRERRQELRLSQAELATRVGTSRQWIIDLERGKPGLGVGLVLRVVEALGATLRIESGETAESDDLGVPEIDLADVIARARGKR